MSEGFDRPHYRHETLCLRPLSSSEADCLAREMASSDPWLRLGTSADRLRSALIDRTGRQDAASEHAAIGMRTLGLYDGEDALLGCLSVKPGWLLGPYLALFFVRSNRRSAGIGGTALDWFETEARSVSARNLWVCVSAFNRPAFAFYQRFGFEQAAMLDDLVVAGEHERLLRKQLFDRS